MKRLFAILSIALLTGCATRPYTPQEKNWMAAALTAQALDVATTSYILSDGGIEANGLWWGEDSGEMLAAMLSTKMVICGGVYLIGQVWPSTRATLWGVAAAAGGGASAWNLYQIGARP